MFNVEMMPNGYLEHRFLIEAHQRNTRGVVGGAHYKVQAVLYCTVLLLLSTFTSSALEGVHKRLSLYEVSIQSQGNHKSAESI